MAVVSGDYRCIATVEVPADQAAQYDTLLCQSASVFKSHDWRLLAPGQKAAVFDATGAPPGLVRKLLHVWQIPSFDSLPQVMAYAADNPSYVSAQQMTLGEMQNLYIALRWDSPIGLPETPIKFYMMETLRMVNGVAPREAFAEYMDSAVYTMNSSYGWTIVCAGNAATGAIDEYVNVWGMADPSQLEAAITAYRSEPRWAAAVSRVTTSTWTPRPLPCFESPGLSSAATAATAAPAAPAGAP